MSVFCANCIIQYKNNNVNMKIGRIVKIGDLFYGKLFCLVVDLIL